MEYNNDMRKSRDQKFITFFLILQKEYVVAELRKKIYPDAVGKAKSVEIMKGKKKKIFDIAMRNNLKTIFPDMKLGKISLYDVNLRIKIYKEIYGNGSPPNFIYRDNVQKEKLRNKDIKCYFMLQSEFRYPDGVGYLQDVDFDKEVGFIKVGNEIKEYKFCEIQRIL